VELVWERGDGGLLSVRGSDMGTGTAMWRAGSAGMQDLASHEKPRGWQLSAAMAARSGGSSPTERSSECFGYGIHKSLKSCLGIYLHAERLKK